MRGGMTSTSTVTPTVRSISRVLTCARVPSSLYFDSALFPQWAPRPSLPIHSGARRPVRVCGDDMTFEFESRGLVSLNHICRL